MIIVHDVLEPLKQALLASRDVIISSQICGSKLQRVFTLGDGCWLPIHSAADLGGGLDPRSRSFPETSAPSTFSKALPYKWEAYCRANRSCAAEFPFLEGLEARKVLRCKWGAYRWQIGGVLQYLLDNVYGLGAPEHCLPTDIMNIM